MTKPIEIHFVIWPDGKMFEKTQTSVSEQHAWAKAIRSWLPVEWFPGVDLNGYYGAGGELRKAMERAGFKCHTITVAPEIAEGVSA